jgi:hypothetical protein
MLRMLQIVDFGTHPVSAVPGNNHGQRNAEGDQNDVEPPQLRLQIIVGLFIIGRLALRL